MFRPFAWDPELDDYRLDDLDLETSRDDYKIEVVRSDERIVRSASSINRYNTTKASSFRKDGHVYYRLRHGDEYKIRMMNNTGEHVNAMIKIDSDTMGKWRIAPYQSVTIERPAHNSRKFTFVKEASDAAREGGVRQGSESSANGLVEVTFIPMVDKRPDSMRFTGFPLTNSLGAKSFGGDIREQSVWRSSANSDNSANSAMMNSRGLESQYAMNSVTESDTFGEESARMSDRKSKSTYESGATVLGEDSIQQFGRASRYFVESKDRKVIKRVRIVIDNRGKYASLRDRDDGHDEGRYDDPVPPKAPSYIN
jgi:hypothetical protein